MVLWLLSAYSHLIQVFCIYGVSLLCFGLCAITSRAGPCEYPLFPAAKHGCRFSCMKYDIFHIAFSLHLHQHLLFVEFLTMALLPSVWWYLPGVLICIPNTWQWWPLSMWFLFKGEFNSLLQIGCLELSPVVDIFWWPPLERLWRSAVFTSRPSDLKNTQWPTPHLFKLLQGGSFIQPHTTFPPVISMLFYFEQRWFLNLYVFQVYGNLIH